MKLDQSDRRILRDLVKRVTELATILEIALFDTHTCENHPERFDQWTEIAHQEVNNYQ